MVDFWYGRRVLITGGSDERDDRGAYRDAEMYDPHSSSFSAVGEMHRARYKHQGTMTLMPDGRVNVGGTEEDLEFSRFQAYLGARLFW